MLTDQPQPPFRHYCRICKKAFGCGRALGGHMRAHGINDDGADDPSAACFDDKPPGHKRTYSLRTNPNRFKSCRFCENCGKEFLSSKSFLEHGRCTSDDDDAEGGGGGGRGDSSPDSGGGGAAAWFKGKRSRRERSKPAAAAASSEEEDLAKCLVMLSAARVDPILIVEAEAEAEESCASASKEDVDRRQISFSDPAADDKAKAPAVVPRGMFECKACKKVFSSHQALGGHRASHKKVKGCFAAKLDVDLDDPLPITLDDDMIVHENVHGEMSMPMPMPLSMSMAIVPFDSPPLAIAPIKKKSKVHECSICHRVFASGQALGGHKRCHWLTSNSPDPAAAMPQKLVHQHHHYHHQVHHQQLTLRPMAFDPSEPCLDLNLPAPGDDLRRDMGSPLRLDVPAAMYLQTWAKKDKGTVSSKNDQATCRVNVEDEADSKVKRAKLSDLKDMGGESSAPWLQVGIGSSGNEGGDP